MALLDVAAAAAALKEMYDGQEVVNLCYEDRPFLALVPKMENAVGENIPLPNLYATSQGQGANFQAAQGQQTAPQLGRFSLTRRNYFSIASVSGEAMEASATDIGAFLAMAKVSVDSAFQTAANAAGWQIYSSGTGSQGSIGQVGPISTPLTLATGQIQLTNVSDAVKFEYGMTLQANATDGGATPRAALGYVVGVDRDQGIISLATAPQGALALPSGWAANDFLLINGNNNGCIQGLSGWLPTVAPAKGDNWFGLDRSVDATRLAGVRFPGQGLSIRDALIQGVAQVVKNGGNPKHAMMNIDAYAALQTSLEGNVIYTTKQSLEAPTISFEAMTLQTPKGKIEIIGDRFCTPFVTYLLQMDTWKLYSLQRVPKLLQYGDDIRTMLRVYNQDAAEIRVGYRANIGGLAPGKNGVVSISF